MAVWECYVLEGMHLVGCETPVIVAMLPAVEKALLSNMGHSPVLFLAVQFYSSALALPSCLLYPALS